MSLPEPSFIDRDPDAITAEIVAQYELLSGKTLYPAQVERLLIDHLLPLRPLALEADHPLADAQPPETGVERAVAPAVEDLEDLGLLL